MREGRVFKPTTLCTGLLLGALLFNAAFSSPDSTEAFSQGCKYVLGVTSELSTLDVLELGVFAAEDLEAKALVEVQPSAVFPAKDSFYSVLANYVHGFNKTHTVLFFGSSSLMNHGHRNLAQNQMLTPKPGRFGAPNVTVKVMKEVSQGQELFSYYNPVVEAKEGKIVTVPWFEKRGLSFVNTSDTEAYPGVLTEQTKILPGCADNQHLKILPMGGVEVLKAVRKGEAIETNRALFLFNDVAANQLQSSYLNDLFWHTDSVKKVLSLGNTLPFADYGTDETKANVKMEWFLDQVSYTQDMGIISVVASKDIAPGEKLYFLSESSSQKVLPTKFSRKLSVQRTWLHWAKETYAASTLQGNLYMCMILGFGMLFLFT